MSLLVWNRFILICGALSFSRITWTHLRNCRNWVWKKNKREKLSTWFSTAVYRFVCFHISFVTVQLMVYLVAFRSKLVTVHGVLNLQAMQRRCQFHGGGGAKIWKSLHWKPQITYPFIFMFLQNILKTIKLLELNSLSFSFLYRRKRTTHSTHIWQINFVVTHIATR